MASKVKSILSAAILAGMLAGTSAVAAPKADQFSALQGLDAQAMSAHEMEGVYGQITLDELKDAIANSTKLSDRSKDRLLTILDRYPRLAKLVVRIITRIETRLGR